MTISIPDGIFLTLGLLTFIGIFICVGMALHVAYTKIDVMLKHLKNSSAVMVQAPLRQGGPWGKLLLIGWIAGVVTFSEHYLKHDGVSVEDLNNFPVTLKRRLIVLKWATIVFSSALIILLLLRESGLLK